MPSTNKTLPARGRIFGRDFISRVRSRDRYFGIRKLANFYRIDFGKRTLYISRTAYVFHNMAGLVANPVRTYIIRPV
jgi:hypothetical protein